MPEEKTPKPAPSPKEPTSNAPTQPPRREPAVPQPRPFPVEPDVGTYTRLPSRKDVEL